MKLLDNIRRYHFELKHLLVLFIVLIFFQLAVSTIHKVSLSNLLKRTQNWYKKDSAGQLANLTTISLELLLEMNKPDKKMGLGEREKLARAFNIILNQQLLQSNVKMVCVLVHDDGNIIAIDNGQDFIQFLTNQPMSVVANAKYSPVIALYEKKRLAIKQNEIIVSQQGGQGTIHVFVPVVPNGEYAGTLYMKIQPDLSFINTQLLSSYDQTSLIFSALILFGLMAMFYISSYSVRERDMAQDALYKEQEVHVIEQVEHRKESQFTKRIYHTHHKAEKVMGFIKEDIGDLRPDNFDKVKDRVLKYSNFVARAIYDMKWYDPPLQTIRNPIFSTDINKLIPFLIENVFERLSAINRFTTFIMELDPKLPLVHINEYVVWEILEPLIQNSIDHATGTKIQVQLSSKYDEVNQCGMISIDDNGPGISDALLEKNEQGVKKIFLENITTKKDEENRGYGCFLANEICKRCGWHLDVTNKPAGGAHFFIRIDGLC